MWLRNRCCCGSLRSRIDRLGDPHEHRRQVKLLPDPIAREVLDFVGFLREGRDRAEWRDLMNAQAQGLAAVWDNREDKVRDDV